ncbi:hypothetical protein D9M68_434650 [compost metagenome]
MARRRASPYAVQEISARKLPCEGGRRGTGHVVGVRKGVFPGVPRGGGAHRFSSDPLAASAVSGRGSFVCRLARCRANACLQVPVHARDHRAQRRRDQASRRCPRRNPSANCPPALPHSKPRAPHRACVAARRQRRHVDVAGGLAIAAHAVLNTQPSAHPDPIGGRTATNGGEMPARCIRRTRAPRPKDGRLCSERMSQTPIPYVIPQSSGQYCAGTFAPRLVAREKTNGGTS